MEPADVPSSRRQSAYGHTSEHPRIGTIREASYDDGAAILLGDDGDDERDGEDERSSLLAPSRRKSRRQSYGATSEPVGQRGDRVDRSGRRRRSDAQNVPRAGTSRSRSVARTPPRKEPVSGFTPVELTADDMIAPAEEGVRGRDTDERPLSPVSTKYSLEGSRQRRGSMATRFGDDSSGDEGGDVARGLLATGAGAVFGGRAGMGMTPAGTANGAATMELDPAEELDAEDLELPIADDGREGREWTEAIRVSLMF